MRLYWPRWNVWRVLRIALGGLILAAVVEVGRTAPYLGLPFEPKPVFLDCYDQAVWNGRAFVPTGKVICLGDLPSADSPR